MTVTAADAPSTDQDQVDPSPVVLVTGGSKGIGRGTADRLAKAGYRVAATYRSGDVPAGVFGVRCDVTDREQVERAFTEVESTLGTVGVLVANAGITRDTLLMRMSDDDWDSVIAKNLTGSFHLARRAVRPMIKNRFGRLVFISSVVGHLGSAGQTNYAASKAGLLGMARSLARELGPRGVTANVVAPGFVETDMTTELTEKQIKGYAEKIPLGRFGSVDDISAVVEFLASDAASYITGALIPVDGGLGMGH